MLRIGVIGCGKITVVRHAPEYDENPNCELIGWFDAFPERAQAMADLYGGKVCESIDELLEMKPDAVSVCVANCDHAEVTIRALEAGCHVLCEKPMAVTLQECEAMVEAARRTGKRLMLGHNQRYNRAHIEAKKLIASGEMGKVLSFHTMFGHPGPEGWTGSNNSWFYNKQRAGFGALADLGIHKTDLLHFLLGEPIVRVSAVLSTIHKTLPDGSLIPLDDNAICLYQARSGATGHLHVSWTNYGKEDNSTRIYCEKGVLRMYDDPEYSLIIEHEKEAETVRLKLDEMTTNEKQTEGKRTSTGVIDAFVESILAGVPSVAEADEALKAMRVVFAAEKSANEGRMVEVVHA